MSKTPFLWILVAFIFGFAFGKSLSIYRIESGPTRHDSTTRCVLKFNTITGTTWTLHVGGAWTLVE
jgi:hypothetical protein